MSQTVTSRSLSFGGLQVHNIMGRMAFGGEKREARKQAGRGSPIIVSALLCSVAAAERDVCPSPVHWLLACLIFGQTLTP